ncbi:hypothetical protein BGZ65_000600 [Modicella reniformis]|uniref:F-box domain-containing protein n=1 Tax=Modicella reniformis TaxID=1440133 RepID=A0A9P6SQ29_9FUNG|nr:hypothetical protein BGZ65_000600 [Modicella reniformis]
MISAKDYTLKRPHSDGRQPSQRNPKTVALREFSPLLLGSPIQLQSRTLETTDPTKKKQRLQSLTDFPNEILLNIQSNFTQPQDLLRFSQTCTLLRELTDDGAWCKAYKGLVPRWGEGVEVGHLRGRTNVWRQAVMDDHLRKTVSWVAPETAETVKSPGTLSEPVRLRIDLKQATHIKPQHMQPSAATSEASRWRNIGPPASHTDPTIRTTLCAYMQTRTYKQRIEYQVAIYGLQDHGRPLATIPSSFWARPDIDIHLGYDFTPERLGVAQLMDVKQFPDRRDSQGRMRVVLILAFGDRNAAPLGAEDGDVQFLDTWLLIKVVEIFICDTLSAGDRKIGGRVETIVPNSRQEHIRGRAVRLYSTKDENDATAFHLEV